MQCEKDQWWTNVRRSASHYLLGLVLRFSDAIGVGVRPSGSSGAQLCAAPQHHHGMWIPRSFLASIPQYISWLAALEAPTSVHNNLTWKLSWRTILIPQLPRSHHQRHPTHLTHPTPPPYRTTRQLNMSQHQSIVQLEVLNMKTYRRPTTLP